MVLVEGQKICIKGKEDFHIAKKLQYRYGNETWDEYEVYSHHGSKHYLTITSGENKIELSYPIKLTLPSNLETTLEYDGEKYDYYDDYECEVFEGKEWESLTMWEYKGPDKLLSIEVYHDENGNIESYEASIGVFTNKNVVTVL